MTAVAIAEVTVTARNPATGSMQWAYKKIFKAGRNANGTISYRGSETIFSDSGASSGDLGADPVFDAVQMHVKIKSNGFNGDLHVSGTAKVFIATSNP